MAATREDVDRWIQTAKENGSKFIISVCDTYDYDDYPVYCKDEKELAEQHAEHNGKNMQSVNEIIVIKDGKSFEDCNLNRALSL